MARRGLIAVAAGSPGEKHRGSERGREGEWRAGGGRGWGAGVRMERRGGQPASPPPAPARASR